MTERPFHRPTPSEQIRLVEHAGDLWRAGYRITTIAEALAVHYTVVAKYIDRAGISRRGTKRAVDAPGLPPLDRIDWRDTDADRALIVPRVEAYLSSTTVALLRSLTAELANDNAENRFANDVRDALDAEDDAWIAHAGEAISGVRAYLDRLSSVLHDAGARRAAIADPSRRDDVQRLHLIRSSAS